jgi:hypothetical protein
MKRLPWLLAPFVVVLVACSDSGSPPSASPTGTSATTIPSPTSVEVTPSPTQPPLPGHPADVRTGIPDVDVVIDALLSYDGDRIASLAELSLVACGPRSDQSGGPPVCPPGVAVGMPVRVFPSSQCEGFWVSESGVRHDLGSISPPGSRIYAVAANPHPVDPRNPAGDYLIILAFPSPPEIAKVFANVVHVTHGRIVRLTGSCAASPEAWLANLMPRALVLPPP